MSIPLSPLLTHSYLFGSILATTMSIQILSGIILSFSYSPLSPYMSIISIMSTLYGPIYSSIHLLLSSLIFMILYIHISSSIYHNSYTSPILFTIGMFLYILLMTLSFLGYTLPFGQMSYWALQVILSLFYSLQPLILGLFSPSLLLLSSFYSIHIISPFIILFLSIMHMILIHLEMALSPLSLSTLDHILFHPFYLSKDIPPILLVILLILYFLFHSPHLFLHPINSIPSNPMVLPSSILPEWYFNYMYTILSSIPSKAMGIFFMVFLLLSIFLFPISTYIYMPILSSLFKPILQFHHSIYISSFFILTSFGTTPPSSPYPIMSYPPIFIMLTYPLYSSFLSFTYTPFYMYLVLPSVSPYTS